MSNITISDLPPITLPLDGVTTFLEVSALEAGEEVSRKVAVDDLPGGITIEDEGIPLATLATTLNFVGAGVVASGAGASKTITILGGGDVTKVGTPVDNEIGVWTGDGTIEGDANFTWDGSQLLFPVDNDAVTPTLAIGAVGTGFYANAANFISVAISGVRRFAFSASGGIQGVTVGAAQLLDEVSSATNPTLIPNNNGQVSGVGGGAGQVALIASALSCFTVDESGGARQIGFYATAPISLQTGVAVTSAGIHAALVALGLITA